MRPLLDFADRFRETHLRPTAQWRELEFPDEPIDWLFDKSGGSGIAPPSWPPHPGRFVGYAGGIGPANVLSVIEAIDAPGPYWIDMESGVRTDDHFDLDLCRQVCEQVYARAVNPPEPEADGAHAEHRDLDQRDAHRGGLWRARAYD